MRERSRLGTHVSVVVTSAAMALNEHGMSRDEVVAHLEEVRRDDKDWRHGRCFGLVFSGGEDVEDMARAAWTMFMSENALNPMAFPSTGYLQQDVVDATAALLHGGDEAAGFMTSGGTESLLMAVKSARERGAAERSVDQPEMVVADSAHAALHKAAKYFKVKLHKIPVGADFRADVDAMADAVNDNTVLIVGSAPQYPHGVIDPIPELAAIAAEGDINCHVDACMGGFVLPFMEQLGEDVPPWDFRVDGVTSISADIHKLGYAPKGASLLIHRNAELRKHQVFLFDDWLGGFYASPGIAGSRSAAPIAAAWAVMHYLGQEGYRRLVRVTLDAARRLAAGVRATPGLTILGDPPAHNLAIGSANPDALDVFKVMDVLAERGWQLDRQKPPDSLHATVAASNAPYIDEFLADLGAAVEQVGSTRTDDRSTNYAPIDARNSARAAPDSSGASTTPR